MSLSFEESLKQAQAAEEAATIASLTATEDYEITTLSLVDEEGMIPAYSGEEETAAAAVYDMRSSAWIPDNKYLYYAEYSDDAVSMIDNGKNVILDQTQINITQESNSQYIPFQMARYYDGFDLATTTLMIHFVNKNGYEDYANPINVYKNDSSIKFAWLVDKRVTAVEGNVRFEIHAVGVNSKGDEYVWKTKPCDPGLNILQSLCGNGIIEPDSTWITSFMTQVMEQVALAQEAAQSAQDSANEVQAFAQQASDAAQSAQNVVDTAKMQLEAGVQTAVDEKVEAALDNYCTDQELQTAINGIDGLANFDVQYNGSKMTFYNGEEVMNEIDINSDPTAEWTAAYTATVDEKVNASKTEAQNNLNAYKETVDADLESIHTAIDGLPETLASDYYTKTDSDDKFATKTEVNALSTTLTAVESTANTNKTNITTISEKVVGLEDAVNGIDKSPRLTYEATYDEEQIYTLWEIEGEGDDEVRTAKGQFKIIGGSGGGATSSVLKIEYVTKTPLVATINDTVSISYLFSGTDSSGDSVLEGVATWKVGGRVVATGIAVSGENTFDVTPYLSLGTQKVVLSIMDDAGSLVTKSWTVQKIDVRLESTFNDKLAYPMGEILFDYTPYGAISKDIHFVLDGAEIGTVTTTSSGIPMAYTLPAQSHGAHLLEVYVTAEVNGNTVGLEAIIDEESGEITGYNHTIKVVKDIAWFDEASNIPVITTTYQDFTARQYDATNIEFTVHDPNTETPTVEIAVDDTITSTQTLTESTSVYTYKTDIAGKHTITITCGETVKTLKATIEELDIKIEPVTAGLVFDFNPAGKSNNSDREWTNGNISMAVSDNFDWINGGYQIDENGDQYFCIKAGTSATIDYKLFEDDAKKNGKEMKLIFKTTNVQSSDAIFLHCMDNTTGANHIGIEMGVHEATIYGQAGSLPLPYSEEDIIEFEFNISKDTETIPIVMGYEDGVSTRNMVYDDSHNFTQNTPKIITLGSERCDLHIYRMKVYNASLTDRGILNNFIADARNAEEMIDRYNRNQIYDENSQLDPDVLAEKCPHLRVYKLSAPYFTNNKSDKVPGTTIQQIYKNGDPTLDNWTAYNVMHSGQGTSSNNYGAAGRNLDFIMNKSGIDGVDPYFLLGDGKTTATKITMTRTSVPVAYLNAKVNIASSNNLTNAMLANRYNQFNPYKRPFVRAEGVDTSFIKDTMEFHNCVIFIKETDTDLSTHREFADNDWHFYAIGNIGDSKKTDNTRLTDQDDKYECTIEIMDVELPLSDWPRDTMYDAMGYNIDDTTGEKIYIWAKDENLGILHEKIDGEYVLTTDTTVDLNKTYYVDILEHDDFSEDFTYGWRYLYEGDDDEENAEVFNYCKQKWIEFYRFVTTSTDEEFKARFNEYFILDSALYYFLFANRYCLTDNLAKNSFWHYGKTGEVDSDGNPIRKWDLAWGYDMDRV